MIDTLFVYDSEFHYNIKIAQKLSFSFSKKVFDFNFLL